MRSNTRRNKKLAFVAIRIAMFLGMSQALHGPVVGKKREKQENCMKCDCSPINGLLSCAVCKISF